MTKPTMFQTGPEKVVPVKNVYQNETPEYPKDAEGFKTKTQTDTKKKTQLKSGNVGQLVRTAKVGKDGTIEVDERQAAKQIKNIASDIGNLLDRGDPKQKTDVMQKLGVDDTKPGGALLVSATNSFKTTTKIMEKVKGTIDINGVKRLIDKGDISSAQGVTNIINALSNGNLIKVEDFTTKMGVIQGIFDDLQRYGIIDAIDYVLDAMDDIKAKKRALARMVPSMFIRADLDGLLKACDILGAGQVLSLYPNGITALITGFRYPGRTDPSKYPGIRNKFFRLVNRLDPNWNVTTRDGQTINDLKCMTTMSRRFYDMFCHFPGSSLDRDIFNNSGQSRAEQALRFNAMVMIARNYARSDKHRVLREQYPRASFTFRRR